MLLSIVQLLSCFTPPGMYQLPLLRLHIKPYTTLHIQAAAVKYVVHD